MAARIQGLLFDKDGTLFDFRKTWGHWAKGFLTDMAGGNQARAIEIGEHLGFDMVTAEFSPDSRIIAGSPDDIADAIAEIEPGLDRGAFLARFNASAAAAPVAEPVPLLPLLAAFRDRGLKLGVATNDSEQAARAHLDAVGAAAAFDFIAGFDSGFGAKPSPGMQHGFCRSTGLEPAHVLMVGDSAHDLHSGRAAGMRTIAVLTGIATADSLAPLADAVLPHIGHLPDWIDANGG